MGGIQQQLMQQQQSYPPPFPVTPVHVYFRPDNNVRRVSTVISDDGSGEGEGEGEEEERRLLDDSGFDSSLFSDVMATLSFLDSSQHRSRPAWHLAGWPRAFPHARHTG